ncbi:hypothetical protein [Cohnella fermenti]|uniref:Uncharacterized protein n=1 Tax=Cohnella fermenti TaxID=2565925 RepID=A0A4S4C313_9BACL|nr:hypothetical protein [Cohnella fermenti]THF82108.1 hypothetical protein E6C55_06900 [Cohnella fermenti]
MIKSILELLQNTFSCEDLFGSISQNIWIMTAAIAPFNWNHVPSINDESIIPTHTIRVVLRTTDRQAGSNDYVDGTDVFVIMDEVNQTVKFACEDLWAEGPPIFHGGTIPDALRWVRDLAEPFYVQLKDPFLMPEQRIALNGHDEDYLEPAHKQLGETNSARHLTNDDFDGLF